MLGTVPLLEVMTALVPVHQLRAKACAFFLLGHFHTLTQIQPLYLYGPLLAQLPTREPLPSKRLEKPRDQYHDKPPKSHNSHRSGKPDNISWLNQPSRSRLMIPVLKLIFLSRTCLPA